MGQKRRRRNKTQNVDIENTKDKSALCEVGTITIVHTITIEGVEDLGDVEG